MADTAKKTALYDLHVELGGKIVDFAGFLLPIQYKNGILFEHNTVRTGVGLFDVSHMGEFILRGEGATAALQSIVTNRVDTMPYGRCRYTLMCYDTGCTVDDLLIYRKGEEDYMLVVNAANIDKDFAHMCKCMPDGLQFENISATVSQIAMQGPLAEKVLAKLVDMSVIPTGNYRFAADVDVSGINCIVSTTGYTGEAGYELYCANEDVVRLYRTLLSAGEEYGIQPIGLGARDTLRFESSMPLYGHELSADYPANEAGLDFAIKTDHTFVGSEALLAHTPEKKRVGLRLVERGIAREHCDVYNAEGACVGITTSGGPAPTLGGAYAMARIDVSISAETPLWIDVRGKRIAAEIVPMPFYSRAK